MSKPASISIQTSAPPLVWLTAAILLGGCQVSPADCDPRAGGFISGLQGLTSGCYEQRVDIKEQELSSSQTVRQQLTVENQQLQSQKQQTAAQLSATRQQLAALESENARLERQLRRAKTQTAAQQSQKARLQQRLQQVNAEIGNLQRRAQGGSISQAELQREIARLRRERDELASAIASAIQ